MRLIVMGHFLGPAASPTPVMANAFPGLTTERAVELFLSSYALTLGIWQLSHPAPVIEEVTQAGEAAILRPDFTSTLQQSLAALWRGSLMD